MGLLESIAKEQGIIMTDYKQGGKILDALTFLEYAKTVDGVSFSLSTPGNPKPSMVIYNEELTGTGLNATIAHELGHIFMGHIGGNIRPVDNSQMELEANIFKAVLLVADLILQHMKEEKQVGDE